MIIDAKKCIKCKKCIPYCPVGAIGVCEHDDSININIDLCVECGVCLRAGICPTDAFYQQDLDWPRTLRSIFSNPRVISPDTKLGGRGTEEMKTNDVTNRFKAGFLGINIEVGRPGIGTSLAEAEKVSMAIAKLGNISFEKENPVFGLFENPYTGKMKNEILHERVLSIVIEFEIHSSRLAELLSLLKEISSSINTVFSLGLVARVGEGSDNHPLIINKLKDLGFTPAPNGKVNLGMGRCIKGGVCK